MTFARTHGRGADSNQSGRFESQEIQIDLSDFEHLGEDERPSLRTRFFKDHSKTIVNQNDSPDIFFTYSINAYRGCEHGCAYCYARPTHEYLGFSAGLDFESKIFVKEDAPEQLRAKLLSRSWKPETIHMSGITDCYQPAERRFELTRRLLQVLNEFKNPVSLITKNALITRDADVLAELARDGLVVAFLSVTTLDADLGRELEPRTSSPAARLEAIRKLAEAGVPVGVNVAPCIPGLTDHEMPAILKAAWEAGARMAGFTPLRLPYSVKHIFADWLAERRPLAREKVLSLVRDIRGGKLNDGSFGSRMEGTGARAESLDQMFELFSRKYGFNQGRPPLRTDLFRRPGEQMRLF